MYSTRLIFLGVLYLGFIGFSLGTIYYAVRPFNRDQPPLYGSIYSYNSDSTNFKFYSNFSFHIDDNTTYLYYFESGPVAVTNNSLSTIYFSIGCGTAFQRLVLISYNMKKKKYRQSQWILNDGIYHFLHYDPFRERLIGLRDHFTFTLIIEEYDLITLDVLKIYTRQDGEQYAFPYAWCSIFDYEENWIVQVRTRFESGTINAYYIKMDLNLVDKKSDIVIEFRLLPNIHNLCTMTYDIETKTAFVTWQHGSINQNIIMMYMNPYTSEFQNQTLLFEVKKDYIIESIKAIYNEKTHEILFLIDHETETGASVEYWMIIVEFYTMKIIEQKQINSVPGLDSWEFFLLLN